MKTRYVLPSDRPAIQSLIERFGLYGLTHDWDERVFAFVVAENDDGKVVGAAALRWEAECVMALDPDLSRRERIRAAAALVTDGCRKAHRLGVKEIYAPVMGAFSTFARVLRRFRGVRQDDRQQLIISVDERRGCSRSTPALWGKA